MVHTLVQVWIIIYFILFLNVLTMLWCHEKRVSGWEVVSCGPFMPTSLPDTLASSSRPRQPPLNSQAPVELGLWSPSSREEERQL